MIVIRGSNPNTIVNNQKLSELSVLFESPAAVTIGGFDGMHLGHRYIFDKVFNFANENNLRKILITFEPRPFDYFTRLTSFADFDELSRKPGLHESNIHNRLSLLSDKIKLLRQIGFDGVWIMNFNSSLSNLSATEYLNKIFSVINIKYCCVGKDFKFGKNRLGNIEVLKNYSNQQGAIFEYIEDFSINKTRVSSSWLRKLLSTGNNDIDKSMELDGSDDFNFLELAKRQLNRYYGFTGQVVYGQQQGRKLGWPTINIHVKPKQLKLPQGVYAVNIIYKNKKYQAMANWGVRPTVAQKLDLVLEAHILNFNNEIYGEKVYIEFIKKIRDEVKFNSLDELKQQLQKDYKQVSSFFNQIAIN